MFYESTMRERPVISLGWGMPRSRNIVGAMSIAVPLLRRLVLCSSSTRITGTRLVVWAVWGIPTQAAERSFVLLFLQQLRWLLFGVPKARRQGRWVYNSRDRIWRLYVDDTEYM